MIDTCLLELDKAVAASRADLDKSRTMPNHEAAGLLAASCLILQCRVRAMVRMIRREREAARCRPGCVGMHEDGACVVIQ
jgi:hypothetical protein